MVFFPKVLNFFLAITNISKKSLWSRFFTSFACLDFHKDCCLVNLFHNTKNISLQTCLKKQSKSLGLNISKGRKGGGGG